MGQPAHFSGLIRNLAAGLLPLHVLPKYSSPSLVAPGSLRSLLLNTSVIAVLARPRRLSTRAKPDHDLFDYTSGRWIINEPLRMAERRRVFNVDGLRRLAAESVGRSADDILSFSKLAEGTSNRIFLVTMRDGFQMVARIPYPMTVPKYHGIASEVATMKFLRDFGMPIPEVYGYSPVSDNASETEYIFMEYIRGTSLVDMWFDLGEPDVESIMHQVAKIEALMMSIKFPVGGSLYYTKDLGGAGGDRAIPLRGREFCIGPDARPCMWDGKRSQLDIDRGPYKSVEAALIRGAQKEKIYLQKFGRPLLPYDRAKRAGCRYQEQLPSTHIENLDRYLLIAPSLIPGKPSARNFVIRHPELDPSSIMISRSADSPELKISGLLSWQNTAILPAFLRVGAPPGMQDWGDSLSDSLTRPSLPEDFDRMEEAAQKEVKLDYLRKLFFFHYFFSTTRQNGPHRELFKDPIQIWMLRNYLFENASNPWSGETLPLKFTLINAVKGWEMLRQLASLEGSAGIFDSTADTCPISFDKQDVQETEKLYIEQEENFGPLAEVREYICQDLEGRVPNEHYDESMARSRLFKEQLLGTAETDEDRAEIQKHYPFQDMDETPYQ